MLFMIAVLTLFTGLIIVDSEADTVSDSLLAKMFSPILILTEETGHRWGDIIVSKPEPVEIMGAMSADNIWFELSTLDGRPIASDRLSRLIESGVIDTSDIKRNQSYWFPAPQKVDLLRNKFAFFTSTVPLRSYVVSKGSLEPGIYLVEMYLNYPYTTPEKWNDTYEGSGPYAGANFPNTAYVHTYKRRVATYTDSVTVIQYKYFYPYNHWWDNHEGDWQGIDVVVSSSDPSTATLLGVEYRFHGAWLNYYKDWGSKPGLTTNFVFEPRTEIRLIQDTHPVVYVGAGSHAAYPIGGEIQIYWIEDEGGYEYMTHTGKVLSTQADYSDTSLWEPYELKLLPEPDLADTNNMGLADTMSWLGARIRWGTPSVDSSLPSEFSGNESPKHGPYNSNSDDWGVSKGWGELKFFDESKTGPDQAPYPIYHRRLPYENYHHWAVIGADTLRGTVSLSGDVVVFPGAALTIEPGTVIKFAPRSDRHQFARAGADGSDDLIELFVYGTLTTGSSTGWTAADSIFFQRHGESGPAAWGGVHVMDGGHTLLNEYTRLSHTRRGKPTGLTAEPGEEPGTVVLEWIQTDDRSIPWWEYRQQTGSAAWGPWTRMQGSRWNTTTHTVEKLTGGVAYQFQVRGLNRTDLAESEVVAAIPVGFPIEGLAQIEYAENRADVVATYTVPGAAGDAIRWSLAGEGDFIATDDDFFAINGSGQLRFQEPPNYEQPLDDDEGGPNTYHIEIRATPFTGRPASAEASFSALFSAFQGLSAAASAGKASEEAPSSTRTKAVVVTVTDGDDAGMVALPSTARVGQSLTAELVDEDADLTDMVWTWWADDDDVRTASGDTTDSYEPQSADEGRRLQAQVRYNDPFGAKTVVSAPTAAVQPAGVITLSPDPPRMCQPVTAELSGPNKVSGETWTWERRRPNSNNWDVLGSSSSSASSKKAAPSDFANLFNAFNSGSGKRSRYEPRSQDRDWLLRATVSWDGHEVSSADSAPVRANVPWPPRWCFLGERPITAAQPSPATSTSIGWPRKRNGTRLGRPSTAARRRQPVTRPRGSP